MMDWSDSGWAWGWPLVLLCMALLVTVTVVAVVVLVRATSTSGPVESPPSPYDGAERILAEGLARGEIDEVEYQRRRDLIRR